MKNIVLISLFFSQTAMSDSQIENTIICPKISEYYVSNSKKTILTMKDFIGTLLESRESYESLIVSNIELSKTKDVEKRQLESTKVQEIKAGILEKEKRAKENYNNQLQILAEYSNKIKKCWSVLSSSEKAKSGEFINKFQQNKFLSNFKVCSQYIRTTNSLYIKKFNYSFDFFQNKINIIKLKENNDNINTTIQKSLSEEASKCSFLFNEDSKKKIQENKYNYNPREMFQLF
jgi:hypothetical protein